MTMTSTHGSPQHKLHWLAEQALAWLPVVAVRLTVFLEGFFLRLAAAGVRDSLIKASRIRQTVMTNYQHR